MISYRQADIFETQSFMEHTPMIVDLYHSAGGMTMLDNVYEKHHYQEEAVDEKRIYLKEAIKKIMTEMGIWWNKNEQSSREQGLKNLDIIMEKLAQDPRVESIKCDVRNRVAHNLYTVVVK